MTSTDDGNNGRLLALSSDIRNSSIPKARGFSRHFVIHSADLLTILDSLFTAHNNSGKDSNEVANNDSSDSRTGMNLDNGSGNSPANKDVNNANNNNNNNNNDKDGINNNGGSSDKSIVNSGDSADATAGGNTSVSESADFSRSAMNAGDGLNRVLRRRIQKVIRNPNLSPKTKSELVIDLFLQERTAVTLAKQRRLPQGNQRLLGAGAGPSTSSTANSHLLTQTRHRSSRHPHAHSAEKHSDGSVDGHNSDGSVDGDTVVDSDGVANTGDDSVDTNSHSDSSSTSSTAHSVSDVVLSDLPSGKVLTPQAWADKLLEFCKEHHISLPTSLSTRITTIAARLAKFFVHSVGRHTLESNDRRFSLHPTGVVVYQHDSGEMKISLLKLLASLSLSKSKLFQYLTAVHSPQKVRQYTSSERRCISALIRLAGIPKRSIPCIGIRDLCK